jgi:hypothetical protein
MATPAKVMDSSPSDGFKPLKAISLQDLKKKQNNQRKPDEKNVASLRDALRSVVGSTEKSDDKSKVSPKPEEKKQTSVKEETPNTGPKEIPESELKKLLGVE